jgi:methyl-accepting chemotaxis protein
MRIRGKLISMNLFMMAGYITITAVTYASVANMHGLNDLARQGLSLKSDFLSFIVAGKELMVTGNLESALKVWLEQTAKFKADYEGLTKSKTFRAIPGAAKKVEDLAFIWETTQKQIADLGVKIEELVKRNGGGGSEVVIGLLQGYSKYEDMNFVSALSKINTLSNAVNAYMLPGITDMVDTVTMQAGKTESSLIVFIVALALAVMAVSFGIFALFAGALGRRIGGIGASMEVLKARDFSVRFEAKGNDELRGIVEAVNGFVEDFSRVINGVKDISGEAAILKNETTGATVESAAAVTEMIANIASIGQKIRDLVEHLNRSNQAVRDISASIDALLIRIEGQSSLIGRSTVSIEQMNASIGNVAAIAGNREKATRELVAVTKTGGAKIDETNAMILEIVKDIQEITGIISIIDDISTRTNLLSMNAAIEAAHAGNAGRGFSIVAEEIRKLADSTNENSKRITEMIEGISAKIDEVLAKSESSKVGFTAVDKEVDSTSRAMSEIAAATKELSLGSSEIMGATQEISSIAAKVGEEAKRMRTNAGAVIDGIKNIEDIGAVVKNGMMEIEAGTKEINTAMVHVNELQMRSGESIEKLNEEVSFFKTRPASEGESSADASLPTLAPA